MGKDLLKRTPDLRAVADIRLMTVEDGPDRGQRLLVGRNGSGTSFEVALDRGFDVSGLAFKGTNIGWHSPNQMAFPAVDPDSEQGWGFLRNFDGFMVTCGLDHYSRPKDVDVTHLGHPHLKSMRMPLHGRIAASKARLLSYGVDPVSGAVSCEGIVRQASVFGEVLELKRRISLPLFDSILSIEDIVFNRSFRPARHAVLYHLNFGYPFLDRNLSISGLPDPLLSTLKAEPPSPEDDFGERVNVIDSREIPETEPVTLWNPELDISVGLTFSRTHLTKFAVWRAYQSGIFALGIEPRTDASESRPFLQPGESCKHSLQLVIANRKGRWSNSTP